MSLLQKKLQEKAEVFQILADNHTGEKKLVYSIAAGEMKELIKLFGEKD